MIKNLSKKYGLLVSASDDYIEIKKWEKTPSFEYLEDTLVTQIIDELIHSFKSNPSDISISSPKFRSIMYRISMDPFFVAFMFSIIDQMNKLVKLDSLKNVLIIASEFVYFPLILSKIFESKASFDIVAFNTKNAALLHILLDKGTSLYIDSFELKKTKALKKRYDVAIAFLPFQFTPFLQDIDTLVLSLSDVTSKFTFYQPTVETPTPDMFLFSFFTDLTFVQKNDILSFLGKLGASFQNKGDTLWLVNF